MPKLHGNPPEVQNLPNLSSGYVPAMHSFEGHLKVQHGGVLVDLKPFVRILLYLPCRNLGQVLHSQLPVALRCVTPAQYGPSIYDVHRKGGQAHVDRGSKTGFFVDVINGWPLSVLCRECFWVLVDLKRHFRIGLNERYRFSCYIH